MTEPTGRKQTSGSLDDFKKLFAKKSGKKPTKKAEPQRLGPGIVVPAEFLVAQQQLVRALMGPPAGGARKTKSKGAGRENICGIHIGQKLVKRKPTGSLAVVVTVLKKLKPEKVQPKYRIPKQIKVGKIIVPVDVKLGSHIGPHAIGGNICGLEKAGIGRGSIGCFCFKNKPDGSGHFDFLLTANHVIGRFVNGNPAGNSSTDDVFQYADFVAGSPHGDNIGGTLIKMGTLDAPDGTSIDAAMAFAGANPEADLTRHTGLHFVSKVDVGDTVQIFGARSKVLSTGTVRRRLAAKQVPYLAKDDFPIDRILPIKDVLVITPISGPTNEQGQLVFSQGGDSGSLVVTADGNPTAILIAGGTDQELGQISLAGDLSTIQADLLFDGIYAVP